MKKVEKLYGQKSVSIKEKIACKKAISEVMEGRLFFYDKLEERTIRDIPVMSLNDGILLAKRILARNEQKHIIGEVHFANKVVTIECYYVWKSLSNFCTCWACSKQDALNMCCSTRDYHAETWENVPDRIKALMF